MHKTSAIAVLLAAAVLGTVVGGQAPSTGLPRGAQGFKSAPARFTVPDRRQRLASAFADIDRLATEFAAREHIPGAAWGIVVDGDLAHVGAAGTTRAGGGEAIDGDSVFRIASMTKSFTAMAILGLRDAGRLSLDDPVERYVPELRNLAYPTGDAPKITIRHLLSHSAGFPEDNPWGDQQLSRTEAEFSAMLRGGIPFSNVPGVAYEYSNLGFAILGRVVTRASGVPYRKYVTERILRPLGMTATTFEASEVPPVRLAHGYRWEDDAWKEEPPLPDGAFGSMGGMLTTIRDLSRYVAAYLDAWPPRDGRESGSLARSSLREMQQPASWRRSTVGRAQEGALVLNSGGYAFGLRFAQTCQFDRVVAHGGGLPGYGSVMQWLPDYGVGFIAFGSRTYAGWGGIANQVFARLAATGGLEPRVVQPSPALVAAKEVVSGLVAQWDDAAVERVAAMNLFLDRSKERRRAEIARLRDQLGACRPDDGFEFVENGLRGDWLLRCDRGLARASVTIAPTMPPSVQYLEVRAMRPDEAPRSSAGPKACPDR